MIPYRLATLATLLLMGRGVDPEKNLLCKAASDTLGEFGNMNTITELNRRCNDYELLSFKHIQFNSAISSKVPSIHFHWESVHSDLWLRNYAPTERVLNTFGKEPTPISFLSECPSISIKKDHVYYAYF